MAEQTRVTKRFKSPSLKVIIDGVPYNTKDWSLGGVSVGNYTGELVRGKTTTILLGESSYSKFITIPCAVVRKAKHKDVNTVLALRFETMPEELKSDLYDFLHTMADRARSVNRRF